MKERTEKEESVVAGVLADQIPSIEPVRSDVEGGGATTDVPRLENLEDICSDKTGLMKVVNWLNDKGLFKVLRLKLTFGFDVEMIPVIPGSKKPIQKGWQNATAEIMNDHAHLKLLEANNVAVLTGPSSGNLISIDLDDNDAVEKFRQLNPELCSETIFTKGARGGNFWFRIEGEYPQGPQKITDSVGSAIGEFRAGGCITVVDGMHPDEVAYCLDGSKVRKCGFSDILWPEDWKGSPMDFYSEKLTQIAGDPFKEGERGGITLNEPWFVEKFAMEHTIIHDPVLGFYEYNHSSGVWESKTRSSLINVFATEIKRTADASERNVVGFRRSASLLGSLVTQLAGRVEHKVAFHKRSGFIHTRSGMLHIGSDGVSIEEFHPKHYSLAQIPFKYDKDAICPRFIGELLRPALPDNDILLLQKCAGEILLGKNITQTILILEGVGGAGKGQIGRVIDLIIGHQNVAELRTRHLDGRFEMNSYFGKTLLAGRDVPGDFLNHSGAGMLKKLTGGDLLTLESKGADRRTEIVGEFNIVITANSRMNVKLDGDKSAWERRVLIIPFNRQGVAKPIPGFGELLVEEEGEGILNWMIEGTQKLLKDIDQFGGIQLDDIQKGRVLTLLAESDSVVEFVARCVVKAKDAKVQTSSLWGAYETFCNDSGIDALPQKMFEKRLPEKMRVAHGSSMSENVLSEGGGRKRGYMGVRLLNGGGGDIESGITD